MAIDINIPSQVKTYANLAAFPATGSLKTIFIAEDTNKTYRWTGTAYVEVSAAGATGITIGTTAITSGTVGRVLFEGTGNVVQESANLFWDNTASRLQVNGAYLLGSSLINANTTAFPLQVNFTNAASNVGAIWRNGSSTGYTSFRFYNNINDGARALEMGYSGSAFSGAIISGGIAGESGYITTTGAYPLQLGSNNLTRLILASTGNVLINTTTDAGYKLDVNGTARVQDNVTLSKNINGNLDLTLVNSTSGTSAKAQLALSTNAGTATIGKYSTTTSGYKIVSASDLYLYNPTSGDISILNDFATGKIKFSSGGASTAQVTLATTGNLLINTTTDIASSKLTIESTTQGVLFPRMTTTQKNAIASPTAGLMVFDSTLNKLCVRGASAWETITSL